MSEKKNIHFIGIGGVGMSGIALVAAQRGHVVSGSDMKESRGTLALKKAGIEVFIGHDAGNVAEDVDVVVVSTAIPEKNPELAYARANGIPVWHRSQMLAELGVGKKTLACAGTHGKTTTSSMLATTVDRMGLDPSFLIGGTVDGYETNARNGSGDYYIVEADESDGSFVHLQPYVALITNMEADHLDHYGDFEKICEAFADFVNLIPDDGAVVVCARGTAGGKRGISLAQAARARGKRTIVYGEEGDEGAEVTYRITGRKGLGHTFAVSFPDGQVVDAAITRNPGWHNVLNACGVLGVVWACGLDVQAAAQALSTFSGVHRRFELVDEVAGVTIVDDYAHHPTEVRATLGAAGELGFKHVHVLFQPHRYTRTQALAPEFSDAFLAADTVTVMDVYPACEAPIPGVSGKTVLDAVLAHDPTQQFAWMPHRQEVIPYLVRKVVPGDLVICMGAGDVTSMAPALADALRREERA